MHYSFQAETFANVRQLQMRLGCGRKENANGLEFTTNQLLRVPVRVRTLSQFVVPSEDEEGAQKSLKNVYEVS